jgi:hypothetical protein
MSKPYEQQEVQERAERILAIPHSIRLSVINEFHNMAAGELEYGIREEYYPGKPDQFFKAVLSIINENNGGE